AYGVLDAVGAEREGRVGVAPLPLGRVAMGHHEDVLPGRRPAAPAVDEVEHVAADDQAADPGPGVRHVVGGRSGHVERALGVAGCDLDVAGLVPVEDGSRQVVGASDEPVERGDSLDDHGGHGRLLSYSTLWLNTIQPA